jgi:hypothetical protein
MAAATTVKQPQSYQRLLVEVKVFSSSCQSNQGLQNLHSFPSVSHVNFEYKVRCFAMGNRFSGIFQTKLIHRAAIALLLLLSSPAVA